MAGRISYTGGVITNNLVLNLDAAKNDSYPAINNGWRDISGNQNNGTLINGPLFNNENNGSIAFDGIDDYVILPSSISNNIQSSVTLMSFIYIQSTTLFGNILGYNNPGSTGQLFSFQIRINSNIYLANVIFM